MRKIFQIIVLLWWKKYYSMFLDQQMELVKLKKKLATVDEGDLKDKSRILLYAQNKEKYELLILFLPIKWYISIIEKNRFVELVTVLHR